MRVYKESKRRGAAKGPRSLYKTKRPKLFASGRFIQILQQRPSGGDIRTLMTLKVIPNKENGDCLFESILQFLNHVKYSPLPRSAMKVRNDIVKHVIENYPEYALSLLNYEEEIQVQFTGLGCPEMAEDTFDECIELYREHMTTSQKFGTATELAAASSLYGFQYCLVTYNDEITATIHGTMELRKQRLLKRGELCFMQFTGPLAAGHFEFLEPVNPKKPITPPFGGYFVNTKIVDAKSVTMLTKS